MVALKELVDYTNKLLDVTSFSDYCPNGLQVEGGGQVQVLVSGVTASMALIEAAAAAGADALLVHHGCFWKGESPCVTGMKRRRLQALLDAGISLLAYHLPLDAHARLGNNTQLARVLGLQTEGHFGDDGGMQLAHYGRLSRPLDAAAFCEYLESSLGRSPQHIAGSTPQIERVGWCYRRGAVLPRGRGRSGTRRLYQRRDLRADRTRGARERESITSRPAIMPRSASAPARWANIWPGISRCNITSSISITRYEAIAAGVLTPPRAGRFKPAFPLTLAGTSTILYGPWNLPETIQNIPK